VTETLGWGDVDVDEEPRRRRRLPGVLIWAVIAAVVAGIALWPTAKDSLADRAAAWLQRQWNAAQAYDSSRTDIELSVSQQVAAGDEPMLIRMVQALDREQAARLTKLAAAVDGRRLWVPIVESAGKAVRRALLAEAHDLRADVNEAPVQLPTNPFFENPYTPQTQQLVQRASPLTQRMLHSRRLKPHTRSSASLTSAAEMVADLKRVTEAPVDMRLAVMNGSQLDVWDLRTGHVRRNVIGYLRVNPPTGVLPVAGTSLLAQFEGGWQLWPTSGPRPIVLPGSLDAYYQPDHDGGFWRSYQGRIRRYDATGHPVGPWRDYPAGVETSSAATSDAIVTNLGAEDFNNPHPVLWYPETGRIVALPDPCPGDFVTARTTVAYTSCDQARVMVVDTRTGRPRTLRLPRGSTFAGPDPVLSPDGTKMALEVRRRDNPDGPPTTVVYDLTKSSVTPLGTSAAPLTWSADSSVLLLDGNGDDPAAPTSSASSTYSPLAYWKPGMKEIAGIRIPLSDGSFGVAALR